MRGGEAVRLAVFSDVHGNIQALSAVLADMAGRAADIVWCGGDLVGYGANPGEVIDLVRGLGIPTIMGNYDDGIGYDRPACGCDYPNEAAMALGMQSVAWTRQHTDDAGKAYLRNLPHRLDRDVAGHRVVLVHGSPAALNEYLFEHVADSVFQAHLNNTRAGVLIFGHTHKPFHRVLGGRHLINSGSVGKPKHGNPNATYVLIDIAPDGIRPRVIEVPYDVEAAARAVEATDLPADFAAALRTGQG